MIKFCRTYKAARCEERFGDFQCFADIADSRNVDCQRTRRLQITSQQNAVMTGIELLSNKF